MKIANQSRPDVPAFLRWAGGKRWLIPKLTEIFNGYHFRTYYEPFFGAGSIFLGWGHSVADKFVLTDIESELIEMFLSVRSSPNRVLGHINNWPKNKSTYLAIRSEGPNGNPLRNAARFIFLNRLCWNGLFRVNTKGAFNVPYSPKTFPANLEEMIRQAADRLSGNNITLASGPYEKFALNARAGDIIFFDPPYVSPKDGRPPHRCYNREQFSWEDQEKLAVAATTLAKRGAAVIVTSGQGAHKFYSDRFFRKIQIFRNQIIAADSDNRRLYRENLIISKGWEPHATRI